MGFEKRLSEVFFTLAEDVSKLKKTLYGYRQFSERKTHKAINHGAIDLETKVRVGEHFGT